MAAERRPPDDAGDLTPGLGRTLAETQRLNSAEHRAGEAARAALRRRAPSAERHARRRRTFLTAILILLAALGLLGLLVWRFGTG